MTQTSWYARRGKRLADAVASAVLLVPLAPVFAVIAAAVKATSRGPVLFAQERPGLHGKPFQILKFRSMRTFEDSYDADGAELSNSARITPVGRVLRRTSLDELPQLVNVLRGEMSIVGPRPALMYQVERYDDVQRQRLDVRPGITGLAQVRGRNELTWEEKIAVDLEYVRTVSASLDLRIVLRTFRVVISGGGVQFSRYDKLSAHNGDLRAHVGENAAS
ncbi:Undecaprenyl-phosphate galactose phosphotransferase [Cellulomonas flavigena DSM 20109]|uniref:Undecaprenyl-phosphate galactose phosphotransferase n=1 Tax=Cellulomonas flavigena (strain ATCC 482 / DSM 20109 / BCRC 11376 / JCM 18109 / NBRC 3775 / NCIMB 8073 / NRS 134) TaxID=446466 RepID=D5UJF1_CELFN|nr:sugar transferase [Cellulomonas flavigena]ADG73674.1 Undecaprenyl-phosphate galactose phosphotransferase [Cellulomonas flavigena DSM 20109]